MRNVKLTIQYDGTRYAGWQFQKNALSIQEVIEAVVRKILGRKVSVVASGRTDAGVHARAQVAHFRMSSPIPLDRLQMALNASLPKDIVISKIEEASDRFHAQHSAKSKLYRYTIVNNNFVDPLIRRHVAKVFFKLDVALMKKAAKLIEGRHDFKAFQALDQRRDQDSVRTVKAIRIHIEGECIHIDVEANGFLYNMVRNIVGTLVEVGRGKIPMEQVREMFVRKDRRLCGPTMPSRGLCLLKVNY